MRRSGISLRDPLIGRAEKHRSDSPPFRSRGGQGCCHIRAWKRAAPRVIHRSCHIDQTAAILASRRFSCDRVALPLAARGESLAAFDGRCIPAGCVAPPLNTPGILGRRALPAGRLARLGATPDFHHGLLGISTRDAVVPLPPTLALASDNAPHRKPLHSI